MRIDSKNTEFLSNCSVCGSVFGKGDLTKVYEEEAKTVFHMNCRKCKSSALVFLSSTPKGLISIGTITDLEKDEVKEKLGSEVISADEIIEAHEMINSAKGKLTK